MSESILQKFLNLQFLKTDEVENIERLNQAAAEVKTHLEGNKSELICYTLAAIDPQVEETDPTIVKTEEMIIGQWPTFRNNVSGTQDQPTTYIRAVILEALSDLGKQEEFACIIWYSARNVVKQYVLGREEALIYEILGVIREVSEGASRSYWKVNTQIAMPQFEATESPAVEELPAFELKGEEMGMHIKAAAVNQEQAGSAGAGENPHAMSDRYGNGNWQWAKFFGERAGLGIAKELNQAFKSQSTHLLKAANTIGASLETLNHGIGPFFEELSQQLISSLDALERRNQLLWWKEALFSPSMRVGYRSLKPMEVTFALALDFSGMSSPIYPESMDHFLKETLRDLLGESVEEAVPFSSLVEEIPCVERDIALSLVSFRFKAIGRHPLGSGIFQSGLPEGSDPLEVLRRSGIKQDFNISRAELLLWLFHDLQTLKLVANENEPV